MVKKLGTSGPGRRGTGQARNFHEAHHHHRIGAELQGHTKPVTILEFAPRGERLLSAADRDAAITWRVPSERRSLAELDPLIADKVPYALVDGEVVRR